MSIAIYAYVAALATVVAVLLLAKMSEDISRRGEGSGGREVSTPEITASLSEPALEIPAEGQVGEPVDVGRVDVSEDTSVATPPKAPPEGSSSESEIKTPKKEEGGRTQGKSLKKKGSRSRRKRGSKSLDRKIYRLWKKGVPIKKISEEVGLAPSTVYKRLKKLTKT